MMGAVRTPVVWAARAALLLALLAPVLVPGAAAACGKTHPYVGYSGDLTTMDHNVRAPLPPATSTSPLCFVRRPPFHSLKPGTNRELPFQIMKTS